MKLSVFYSNFFRGVSNHEDDDMQNYLAFQLVLFYFEKRFS